MAKGGLAPCGRRMGNEWVAKPFVAHAPLSNERRDMRNERRRSARRANHDGEVWKGLAAGLIGGLVASWTMTQFQNVLSKLSEEGGGESQDEGASTQDAQQSQGGGEGENDDATVKTASAISENVFDHKLTKSEKQVAGPAVHYAFGTTMGGVYGVAAELAPVTSVGAGLPFGAIFWLVADEGAVPALGLSKSPTEYPLSTHAYALASHLVYGLTTEAVRSLVRRVM